MPEQGTTPLPLSQGPLGSVGWGVMDTDVVGVIWLAWVGEGLTMLRFGAVPPPDREARRWMPDAWPVPAAPIPTEVAGGLRRYFTGELVDPAAIPVRLGGTIFQRAVWTALRQVSRGALRTYAGLAADVGSPRAMRAIGAAMAANPIAIVVPCHRVVGAGNSLGGYSGGLERKRALLTLEGARFEGEHVLPGQLELL